MKRLRPIEKSRIGRLQRLYNSSTSQRALARRAKQWQAYSDDSDLEKAAELIEQVAEPILEENALEELVALSRRSRFSRYYSDDTDKEVENIEPADDKLISKLEDLAEKYEGDSSSNFSRKNKLYNRNDEQKYEDFKAYLPQIAEKYRNLFNELVEKGLLFANGYIVDPKTIGTEKKKVLRDTGRTQGLMKILTPDEYDELIDTYTGAVRRTTKIIDAKLSNSPETSRKYKNLIYGIAFVGIAAVIVVVAYLSFASVLPGLWLSGSAIATAFKPLGSALLALGNFVKGLSWQLIVGPFVAVLAFIFGSFGLDWFKRMKERADALEAEPLLQCLININKLSLELSRRADTAHHIIRHMCRTNNSQDTSLVSKLEQEFQHIKDLESEFKNKARCLDE